MKFLGYIFTYSLIWLLHLLPERILYWISDFLYLLIHYVVGYRKKVVYDNIAKAFPDYGKKEIRQTVRRFYHHLCDLFIESSVSHFYSESEALKKITYRNPELLNEMYSEGRQVIAVTGHYGNWEYLSTLGLVTKYPIIAIFKPLRNKYIDRLMQTNRNRFGVIPVPMKEIARKLISFQRDSTPAMSLFLADQRPIFHQIQYWTDFLGLDTPLYLGTEKLARKLNAAVVFLKVRKVKRGRYEVEIEQITGTPKDLEPFTITEAHVRILENLIREEPAYWLWSHRRWKHSHERFEREHGD